MVIAVCLLWVAYPWLVKNHKKALYLDCDIIVKKDLAQLFNTDISQNYLGVVLAIRSELQCKNHDYLQREKNSPIYWSLDNIKNNYFNSGMMLLNLENLRQDSVFEDIIDSLKIRRYINLDEDALNLFTDGKNKFLDYKYNCNLAFDDVDNEDAVIMHYTQKKPWNSFHDYGKYYWHYGTLY